MNKIFFLIWETPSSHQVILPIIKEFSRLSKIYLFSSSNKSIEILDKRDSNYSRYCIHKKISYYDSKNLINKFNLIYFLLISFFNIFFNKPKYIYIINKYPLILVFFIKFFLKSKIIYHNLDYDPDVDGFAQKILRKIELKSVKYLDLLIFSHKLRAKKFFQDAKIKKNFLIFYNSLPKNFYKNYKKKSIKKIKKNLLYFGSIGPGHGLSQLIKSVKYIDKEFTLQIYGWIVNYDYYLKLKELIKKNNLEKKIIFKLNVKDFVWKNEMVNSHLGIALYEVKSLSHKFMFCASQKINAYIAASLPVLVANTKDNKSFLKKYKFGVDTNLNPKQIARTINFIFKKKNFYKVLQKNSKKAFINEFNFEKQIQKIRNQIDLN